MAKNNYKTSDKGIAFIKSFEGEILKGYLDAVNKLTVGVGHLVLPGESYKLNQKITREESTRLLQKDLQRFENCVNKNVQVPITQNQFDALVSFAFNVGESALKRSSVLKNLNNRKPAHAADSFLAWNKAGGRVLPGLTRRRKAERDLFLTPDKQTSLSTDRPEPRGSTSSRTASESVGTPGANPAINSGEVAQSESREAINSAPQTNGEAAPPDNSAAIAVQQAEPAKSEPENTLITKFKAWYLAIPAGITAYLSAAAAWAKDAPVNLIIVLLAIAGAIVVVYIAGNLLIKNRRESRENELKLQRETQSHDLTVLQAQSAMDKTVNTIQIVPLEIQNSDSEGAETKQGFATMTDYSGKTWKQPFGAE